MANYDYKAGKERIKEILDNNLDVIEKDKIPQDNEFTFSNAYYGWVTGLFIDIRNSSKLFSEGDKELVSKIIRSFTSEIIEILRKDDNLREIGIRGDCVYSIYTTPSPNGIYEIVDKAVFVNTFLKMLNELLVERKLPSISVGIGISSSKELVIKAGRKGVNINNNVWIGDAVTKASNLSSLGNKNNYKSIAISHLTYINMIEEMCTKNEGKDVESWFTKHIVENYGTFYTSNLIKSTFNDWIESGM